MLAPAKTPRPIVDRLHEEVQKALALPAVQEKLATQGVEPMPLSPREIRRHDRQGDRLQYRSGKGGGTEVQLTPSLLATADEVIE